MTADATTVGSVLTESIDQLRRADCDTPDLDARLLMMEACGVTQSQLISKRSELLGKDELSKFNHYIQRRLNHEPVFRILNKREFYGREFTLSSATLVPRPDTETLINVILQEAEHLHHDLSILELGTGSGIIAITLALELDRASLVAVDVSDEALVTAKENTALLDTGESITFLKGDMFDPVEGLFDMIVSNPPYISQSELGDLSMEVQLHDPALALDGGEDGLEFYRRIFLTASQFLKQSGVICVEIGHLQANSVCLIAKDCGYDNTATYQDLGGRDRVVVAKQMDWS